MEDGIITFLLMFFTPLISFACAATAIMTRVVNDELEGRVDRHLLFQTAAFVFVMFAFVWFQSDIQWMLIALCAQLVHLRYFFRTTRRMRHLKYIDDSRRLPPRDPQFQATLPGVAAPIQLRIQSLPSLLVYHTIIAFGLLVFLLVAGFICPDSQDGPAEGPPPPWYIYVIVLTVGPVILGSFSTLLFMGKLRAASIDHDGLKLTVRLSGRIIRIHYEQILYARHFEFRGTTSIEIGYENSQGFHLATISADPFFAADLHHLREAMSLRGLLLIN
ncbi:MAG: hypothetical protein NXI24_11820 [bacterium]|nr:hypothetical protein [bacterium]